MPSPSRFIWQRRLAAPGCVVLLCLSLLTSCNYGVIDLDVQGHRGCRGLMPENSLPAFKKAWELGVTTLEMDVVISRDRQVVVSHEAWFSHEFCQDSAGHDITEAEERSHNIFKMDYADVLKYDCGSRVHPRFQNQQHLKVIKPLLSEVFAEIEAMVDPNDYSEDARWPRYNIELKVEPGDTGVFGPPAKEFAQLVLEQVRAANVSDRCTLQSFDLETLRELRRQDQNIQLALLVEEDEKFMDKLAELGFYPEILSPYFGLVTEEMLSFSATKNMKVIPWTVNEEADMRRMVKLGVHGIITDYPDRLLELLKTM
ncbi:MAG: glycerophosphodiester phosphodiesterase family protein [Bacteroidia bacterium]